MSSPKHVIDFTYAGNGALTGIWEAVPGLERCQCGFDEPCHMPASA
ncbi:MAG: hypothetical protein OXD29_07020 [Roseovarius sp.]|nr:hypothetical protein [Roseovarius sp.]MCY4207689.1 hypothetical protein [Roseovarius sp.]MCY4316766.1 hypothetical protein [Roseovarius sp.]